MKKTCKYSIKLTFLPYVYLTFTLRLPSVRHLLTALTAITALTALAARSADPPVPDTSIPSIHREQTCVCNVCSVGSYQKPIFSVARARAIGKK